MCPRTGLNADSSFLLIVPELRGFRAFRYDEKKVGGLGRVLCGPYDVISEEERIVLAESSPHNAVHLILAEKTGNQAYKEVPRLLEDFKSKGILVRDSDPSFTLLEEKFSIGTAKYIRRSLISAVKLSRFDEGMVWPHEKTFSGPKADRYMILTASRTNLSPVFGLISDVDGTLQAEMERLCSGEPLSQAEYAGCSISVYRIPEAGFSDSVRAALKTKPVVLADGHHRFETALKYRDAVHDGSQTLPEPEQADYILMALVPFESKGLVVQPTHRLVQASTDEVLSQAWKRIKADFDLTELPGNNPQEWEDRLAQETTPGFLGFMVQESSAQGKGVKAWLGKAKNVDGLRERLEKQEPGRAGAYYDLDAVIAQAVIEGEGITIVPDRDPSRVMDAVSKDPHSLGLLLRAVPPDKVFDLASSGERFPQKTTYFHPKLPTGIVFRPLA